MTIADLTKATPNEIDAELYRLYNEAARAERNIEAALFRVHRSVGDEVGFRQRKLRLTHDEAIAQAKAKADGDDDFLAAARKALDSLEEAYAALAAAEAASDPLNAEFDRRGGWTRAFLVLNSNGHVHRWMHCSTCFPSTRYAWMTDFSGHSEAEIVDAAGERACTVCYPSAPVDVLAKPTRMFTPDEIDAQKAREERAAAKAKRDADKIAKAPTADGSELRITTRHGRETFKTERAATTWAVQEIGSHRAWGYSLSEDGVQQVIAALAEKHGKTVEEMTAEIEVKVKAWIKRNS